MVDQGQSDQQASQGNKMQLTFDKQIDRFVYSSTNVLGQGSYGKVVLGYDTLEKKLVAVKIFNLSNIVGNNQNQKLLRREIEILQKINDPYIVGFIDVIQSKESLYMIFDFCQEGDLRRYMKMCSGRVPVDQAITFLRQIVNGFKTLWNLKIIHRDIKPANIMIKNGSALIGDFGFARFLEGDSMNQQANLTLLGTPLYMAPQLLSAAKFSSRCDVWSVGIVFYQMLYGVTPWTGGSLDELYNNIVAHPLHFPAEPPVDNLVIDLLYGMLGKTEEERLNWEQVFNHPLITGNLQQQGANNNQNDAMMEEDIVPAGDEGGIITVPDSSYLARKQ